MRHLFLSITDSSIVNCTDDTTLYVCDRNLSDLKKALKLNLELSSVGFKMTN